MIVKDVLMSCFKRIHIIYENHDMQLYPDILTRQAIESTSVPNL